MKEGNRKKKRGDRRKKWSAVREGRTLAMKGEKSGNATTSQEGGKGSKEMVYLKWKVARRGIGKHRT